MNTNYLYSGLNMLSASKWKCNDFICFFFIINNHHFHRAIFGWSYIFMGISFYWVILPWSYVFLKLYLYWAILSMNYTFIDFNNFLCSIIYCFWNLMKLKVCQFWSANWPKKICFRPFCQWHFFSLFSWRANDWVGRGVLGCSQRHTFVHNKKLF